MTAHEQRYGQSDWQKQMQILGILTNMQTDGQADRKTNRKIANEVNKVNRQTK